jgi:ribosomal protein S18 acetylase RimI-like enzyme/DNA-binding transcriptional ArsR family regulator
MFVIFYATDCVFYRNRATNRRCSLDLIGELGELALATRLRRLADTLQKDVTDIYAEVGLDFQARWFPVLVALRGREPLPVTGLARRLGLSHQAVSKTVRLLAARGLVREVVDPDDARRNRLALSRAGNTLCRRLDRVWDEIRLANRELLDETGVPLLADLDRLETALAADSMADRVRRRLDLATPDPVRIEDYRPSYKKHFRRLNEAWLREHFRVEADDRRVLDDPNGRIIRRGGQILFALNRGDVVGTCALLRHDEQVWELAKMAVDPAHRRRGLGRRLADAAIDRVRAAGAPRLWLRTSPRLRAADRLYRSLGFRRTRRHPFPDDAYTRQTHAMVLNLDPSQETQP